ncbi:hypothetical protein, partial [Rhodopirellula baltica]|uniref:hypothetical protein n=1 Tax=Rhodopirellula baltica TaxID=265606 RepID=UPI001F249433
SSNGQLLDLGAQVTKIALQKARQNCRPSGTDGIELRSAHTVVSSGNGFTTQGTREVAHGNVEGRSTEITLRARQKPGSLRFSIAPRRLGSEMPTLCWCDAIAVPIFAS